MQTRYKSFGLDMRDVVVFVFLKEERRRERDTERKTERERAKHVPG